MKKYLILPASAKSVFSLTKTVILILFLTQLSFAQIVIEERVEVNPTPNILLKPLAQHTIHVDLQWTPAEIATFMSVGGNTSQYPCLLFGNSDWQTTGFISYEQEDLTGGIYTLRVSINAPCEPPNTINTQYSVYFDGNILTNGTFELSGCFQTGSFPFVDINFETPLITDYSFNISPASLCLGIGTTPGFTLGHGCTNVEIDTSTEMVNLQILSGGEFTSFYGYQGMITDNLTIPYSALNSVELMQDQFFSGSPTTVLVQSNIGGLIKQDSIIAYPKSSYGINAGTVDYPIQHGDTKYIEVTTYGPGGCRATFPSEIKLNAVITKGIELGYLQDFDHGTTGDTLTNITFNSFGGNHIGFISDGVKKNVADTVIVTYSTTDAEIGAKQVAVIINPSPLYLAIEPENVAPGDTSLIIIKSRQEDGTLIDFPEWQTFEVKMIEGCALGKILAGGDTARYFYDVLQPIKFVADSLGSGTIGLIVGLVEEIIGTRPVHENDSDKIEETAKEKQNKLIAEKTKKEINENPSYNPGAEFCSAEEIQSYTTEEINIPVGDECENLSIEHSEITYDLQEQAEYFKVPHSDEEELKLVELIQVCNDTAHPNQQGGSVPVDYKRYRYDYTTNSFKNSWMVEPYKGTDDRVHYYFINPQTNEATPLLFDFVTGICYLKINPPGHPPNILIENIADVDDNSKIPMDDYEQAFFDFCGHLCYPTEKATYVLVEILEIHEREHMNDFAEKIINNFPMLVQEIENYSDLCQSFNENVRKNAEKVIYDKISNFIKKTIKLYKEESGESGSTKETTHEREIQGRESITNRIGDYKNALVSRFITQLIGKNCQKCSYQ